MYVPIKYTVINTQLSATFALQFECKFFHGLYLAAFQKKHKAGRCVTKFKLNIKFKTNLEVPDGENASGIFRETKGISVRSVLFPGVFSL